MKNMDKQSIIAIILCVIFYVAYMQYLQGKYPDFGKPPPPVEVVETKPIDVLPTKDGIPKKDQTVSSIEKVGKKEVAGSKVKASPEPTMLSPSDLKIETENSIYTFDQKTSAIVSIKLKNYTPDTGKSGYFELLDSPLVIQGTSEILNLKPQSVFDAVRDGNKIIFSKTDGDWRYSNHLEVYGEYGLKISTEIKNVSNTSQTLVGGVLVGENFHFSSDDGGFGAAAFLESQKNVLAGYDDTRDSEVASAYCQQDENEAAFDIKKSRVDYLGFDLHYFMMLFQPDSDRISAFITRRGQSVAGYCSMAVVAYQDFGRIESGASASFTLDSYMGPKELEILGRHNSKFADAVDFGWFSIIAYPLLQSLKAINDYTTNFGWSIIIITVLIKLAFYPLTRAAAVSMKKMQQLQPQMKDIREKYKSDPQRQQRELMSFMSANKVNPMKGCLPILPQIPVFIAFYRVLPQAIELRHAPFLGWITDLSIKDPYYITPLLLGVGMFFQQKLTPSPGMDETQKKIMMMMPIIFTVMMLSLPAGMVLYMIANTIVSIAQQQWLNRKLDRELAQVVVAKAAR